MADPKTQDPAQDPAQDADGESEGRYRHTREAFHELPLEQQARFLVEATASTMARGLEVVARSVADDMEEAFRSADPGATEEPNAPAGEASDPDDTRDAPDDSSTA